LQSGVSALESGVSRWVRWVRSKRGNAFNAESFFPDAVCAAKTAATISLAKVRPGQWVSRAIRSGNRDGSSSDSKDNQLEDSHASLLVGWDEGRRPEPPTAAVTVAAVGLVLLGGGPWR
jgi:hypothetical protein